MGDLPAGNFLRGRHPLLARHLPPGRRQPATLYTGFDYFDPSDAYHAARGLQDDRRRRDAGPRPRTGTDGTDTSSTTAARSASTTTWSSPTRPTRTSSTSLGSYGYDISPQSGGIFRSTDGGATWKNLGYDLHPDFHAFAFQPDDTQHVADRQRRRRLAVATPAAAATAPATRCPRPTGRTSTARSTRTPAALIHSTGLAITQFTSIATVPDVPGQYWGGTQDNGTLRKSLAEQPLVRPGQR